MTWLWIGLAVALLAGLAYWQLIIAEGAYLGPRVVAWTYDWVARRYEAIKQFSARDDAWFLAAPVLQSLHGIQQARVLDVATGSGRLPRALLREHFDGPIVGLDLSWGMLRQARSRLAPYGDQVGWVWQDAQDLPFEDGAFDAVTCLEALEFLPRPSEALAELVRVLAPGGVLLVTNRVGLEARLLPRRAIPRAVFEGVLRAAGLAGIEVVRWQTSYDLALARKPGERRPGKDRSEGWRSLLRCAGCRGALKAGPAGLCCPGCGEVYPWREGILSMSGRRRGARRA